MNCPICGSSANTPVLAIDSVPASCAKLFGTRDQAMNEQTCELNIVICLQCAHVWNSTFHHSVEALYDADYYSSFTKSSQAQEYQQNLAFVLNSVVDLSGKTVLEIGCGDAYFLDSLTDLGAKVIGYEPSSTYILAAARPRIKVVNDFFRFDGSSSPPEPVDVVVMRHVLEHMESPKKVLTTLRTTCFPTNSLQFLLLEVPNARQLLRDDLYFDFYNDHIQYFSHASLTRLAHATGWTPIYQSDDDDEFIRLILRNTPPDQSDHQDDPGQHAVKESLIDAASKFQQDFQCWKKMLVNLVNTEQASGNRIAAWGAGARGVTLLAGLGQVSNNLSYVIDSDANKWGKHLPVTGLPVWGQQHLSEESVNCVLVTSYTYFDEIYSQLGSFRDRGGRILKVYPTPEIIT